MMGQADELYKICSIMGSPTEETWPEGLDLAAAMNFRFPKCRPMALASLVRVWGHAPPLYLLKPFFACLERWLWAACQETACVGLILLLLS